MKILYANNYLVLRGGSERVMFEEREFFQHAGHAVSVFGRHEVGSLVNEDADLFPPLIEFGKLGLKEKLSAVPNVIYNRGTGRLFGQMLDRKLPDIVHGHNIYAGLTTSIIDQCRKREIPFLLTLHDYKLVCPSYLMLNAGAACTMCVGGHYHHCARTKCHKGSGLISAISAAEAYFNHWLGKWEAAARIITPSRFLINQMLAHGIGEQKLRLVPNGIKVEAFEPHYQDSGYFLYFGRLSPEKGLDTLIQAAVGCGMPLLIAGEGPERARLESLAAGLKAEASFVGRKTGDELTSLVREAAFVVVPSEWFENASMAVLEAMALGKAVVGARIGGIPEQVADQESGILFEPGSVEELGVAIRRMASNPTERVRMGRSGRERVAREFALQLHCERLRDVYREAANC